MHWLRLCGHLGRGRGDSSSTGGARGARKGGRKVGKGGRGGQGGQAGQGGQGIACRRLIVVTLASRTKALRFVDNQKLVEWAWLGENKEAQDGETRGEGGE